MAGKGPSDAKVDVFDQSGFNPQLDDVLTKLVKDISYFNTGTFKEYREVPRNRKVRRRNYRNFGS